MDNTQKLRIAREALQWSYEMFLHRDIMNAQVHCSPLRKSPITEKVLKAIEIIDNVRTESKFEEWLNQEMEKELCLKNMASKKSTEK